MRLSIIIPVFNEAKTIEKVLAQVKNLLVNKEIIIVDDYSTDGTRGILKNIKEAKIIYHDKNQGKGAAIRTGLKYTTGDIIIIQDADLEYNPAEYPALLKPILDGEAKVVYGSRFLNPTHSPRYRLFYLGNKFLSSLSSILYNQKITDMETCYKVFRREVIDNIEIESNRFDFEPEITAKIIKAGHKIKEVPISYNSRSFSEGKKIGWRDGVMAIYKLIKYRLKK